MIVKKTYFMLLISAFTFMGLSAIQNLSYFTNVFGEVKISINLTAQEEENETSNNEVKEVKEQLDHNSENHLLVKCNSIHELTFHDHLMKLNNGYLEVATPPPELFIG